MGGFGHIREHFRDLQARGPLWGYFPEPTKSILVVAPRKVARAEDFFSGMGIKVVTDRRYLRIFVGDREAEDSWMVEKVQGWSESVKILSGSPASTRSPLTQDCRIHSNSSGHSCSGSPQT